MFLIGETIHVQLLAQDIKVTEVTANLLKGTSAQTGLEVALALTSHSYKDLLLTTSVEGRIASTVHHKDSERKMFIHPNGTVYSAKWYGKQYQWSIDNKQSTASKVWAHLYGL